MSLAGASAIIAQIAVVPLATVLLGATNWQTADRFVALLIVLVIAPMGWWLIRNTPSEKGTYPDGNAESAARVASESGAGLTFRQAIRQPAFWQLTAGLFTCGVTMSFPASHLMAYAGDMGMSDMTASETIGLAGLLSLPGALALGFLGDRSSRTKMLAVAYLLRSITYLVLLQAHNPTIMLAAGVSLGLSWGATVPLTSAIVADLFGCKAIATIVTTMTMVMFMASGTFSYLAGLDFTVFGNYSAALISAAVLGAIACVCCFTIRERSLVPATTT
jgi:predicted MFS family arabinose efflux permease